MSEQKKFIGKVDWMYIVNSLIKPELAKYVKSVSGKDLSSNDFTDALLAKLNAINMDLYSTTAQMNAAILKAVNDGLATVTSIKFEKPANGQLPATGQNGVIYLIPNGGAGKNTSDEYFWDGTKFELFGTTEVDLTDYVTYDDLTEVETTELKAVWDAVFNS